MGHQHSHYIYRELSKYFNQSLQCVSEKFLEKFEIFMLSPGEAGLFVEIRLVGTAVLLKVG